MNRITPILAAVALAASVASAAVAQTPPAAAQPAPQQIRTLRGTIAGLDGQVLTIKGDDGQTSKVTLAADYRVFFIGRISMADIKPGSFVATANMDQPDGSGVSTELRVFSPELKGLGEGHYPMDDGTGAMMTNGTVTNQVASTPRGQEMDVAYSGQGGTGVRHLVVPKDMVIRSVRPGTHDDVKVGAKVEVRALVGADGSLAARSVRLGENGQAPAQ